MTDAIPKINNYIHGIKQDEAPSSSSYMSVTSPSTSDVIAHVYKSTKDDVEKAVESSKKAFGSWSNLTMKSRVAILLKFNYLVKLHAKELAELIVQENGKNITEGMYAKLLKRNVVRLFDSKSYLQTFLFKYYIAWTIL